MLSNKEKRTKISSNRWGKVWATDKSFISLKVLMKKQQQPRQMYRVKGEYSICKALNKMHASEWIRWKSGDQNKYCSNGPEQDEEETMKEEMIKEKNTRSGIHFQQCTQATLRYNIGDMCNQSSRQKEKKEKRVSIALKIHNSKVAWQRRKIYIFSWGLYNSLVCKCFVYPLDINLCFKGSSVRRSRYLAEAKSYPCYWGGAIWSFQ